MYYSTVYYFNMYFFVYFFFFLYFFFFFFFFFFQAEDGIRDRDVTGVQTCALPISRWRRSRNPWLGLPPQGASGPVRWRCIPICRQSCRPLHRPPPVRRARSASPTPGGGQTEIGRASCRERG